MAHERGVEMSFDGIKWRTKEERERDDLDRQISELRLKLAMSEKKILNRVFVRNASLQEMVAEKAAHRKNTNELNKLLKRLEDKHGTGK